MATAWAYRQVRSRTIAAKKKATKKRAAKKRPSSKTVKVDTAAIKKSRVELLGKDFQSKAFESKTVKTRSTAPQQSTQSPDKLFLKSDRYKQLRENAVAEVKTSFGIIFITKNPSPIGNNVGYIHIKIPGEAQPIAIPLNAEDTIDIKDGFISLGKIARKFT